METEKPIALEAYETIAERFSEVAETKAENAFIEQPAIREVIGNVSGLNILEAGCGPGILAKYLLSHQPASLVAFDLSPKMIGLARRRLEDRVPLHLADLAQPLQFAETQSFDLVVSSLAMDYVRNWEQPLSEFKRVLKTGGRLVFSQQHPQGAYKWYQPPSPFGVHLVQAVWRGFGGEPVIMPDYYRSFDEVINPLANQGFRITRVVDCQPIPELQHIDPLRYDRYSNQPTFLVIEARV